MSERIREVSIHFQLLVFGTVLFLGALFWPVLNSINGSWSDARIAQCILHSLWLLGTYLGFVVVVAGHALLVKRETSQESDKSLSRD